ncbi:tyrosine-protein phosphatase [Microbulbifer pacificus]|uniref:Tyrosine-protein phosphatase n=1 Tax=Microbulbifer pacificus TaxID=407164 RepID=A0AAU0MWV6_9GAMM|nr:tyrosine-protein phosphatase [Microbulbifer pacificus]WOX04592.1 tyrosine-protein phosphatase [Microbulbifer pacificus]
MKKVLTNGILAAAVAMALGACSATAPVADKAQSATVLSEVEHVRLLPLEGGRNFRDIGGYKNADGKEVKWGKIYRSGVLENLTAKDFEYLRDREIATIVDFRSSEEREDEPTNWQAGEIELLAWDYDMGDWQSEFAKVFAKPGFARTDIVQLMDEGYKGTVHQQAPHYRAMFARLIESDEPLLFHCTGGKDRTGIGAALVLTALGVDRETVMQDYLLSTEILKNSDLKALPQTSNEKESRMYAFIASLPEDVRDALIGVEASYLESAFAEMEREHGSVEGYIENALDVDAQELALLKARYLQ